MALVDVVLTYQCNLGCAFCTVSGELQNRQMDCPAVLDALRGGRARGYDEVSFTGGEPTLRRDLPALVRASRQLGYAAVKIHSNGLLYSHAPNIDRLVAAGATLFHVSVPSHEEMSYERTVRRLGAFRLMEAGLGNLVARAVALRADVLITSDTYPWLTDSVRWLYAHGVRRIDFWYVSLTDANRWNVASLPAMADAVPSLRDALAAARSLGVEARSLHVPRCLLGQDAAHAWDPGAQRVLVVTPDAEFELKDSRLTGRVHVPACEGCPYCSDCPGIRPDYLERFGDGEIAAARATAPAQGGSGASPSS